jgi:hypothetical protein
MLVVAANFKRTKIFLRVRKIIPLPSKVRIVSLQAET